MGFFSKKWQVAIVTVAAISAGSFVLEHFVGFNPIEVAVNTVAVPIKNGFYYVANSLETARDFVWDMRAYKADNERLESEVIKLKRENRDVSEYKAENERLKGLLELKESAAEYTTVAAEVISRSQNDWYNTFEIGKGSLNGIERGDTVITADGIVGRVTEVGPNYSVVTTVLDESSVIGIKVSRTQGTGLAEGDKEFAKNMQCKLSFVDRNTPVIVGDIIETSGSGGIYPPGLVVGTVVSVSADSAGSLNFATIEPSVDFDLLREVLVITGA